MARGWVGKIKKKKKKNQLTDSAELPGDSNSEALLTLVFPDEISLRVMQRSDVGTRLALAIKEIFAARVRVEMTVEGTREERLRRIQEERRDTALTVTVQETAPSECLPASGIPFPRPVLSFRR